MKFSNMTPHDIVILNENNEVIHTIKPCGMIARAEQKTTEAGSIEADGITVQLKNNEYGVPYIEDIGGTTGGQQVELLNKQYIYIVSRIFLLAVSEHMPEVLQKIAFVTPGDLVRDMDGKIIGCKNFYAA